jgi:hypothetical protein
VNLRNDSLAEAVREMNVEQTALRPSLLAQTVQSVDPKVPGEF